MTKSFFEKHKTMIIVGIVILVIFGMIVGMYNKFVTLDQNVNGKWSQVENDYQRQADLIPNLISIVSSSVNVETNYVKDVTDARSQWQSSSGLFEKDMAGADMNNAMTNFITAVMTTENYPELQANKQYIALTDEVSGTQNRIVKSRKDYIEAVQAYNIAIKRFPANVFAGMFGFTEKDYYEAEAELITPVLGEGTLPQ